MRRADAWDIFHSGVAEHRWSAKNMPIAPVCLKLLLKIREDWLRAKTSLNICWLEPFMA